MKVCGVTVDPDSDVITIDGDPDIGDQTGISGTCCWKAYRQGKLIAWQFMYVKHYSIFNINKCIRVGLGWKIWDNEKLRKEPAQYWLYFNPIK